MSTSNQDNEEMESSDISVLSVITSDSTGDTAVQLVQFIHDDASGKLRTKLNDDVFESLEKLAAHLPISVITICGQSTQGNSFVFSHIAKALESAEKNDSTICTDFGDRSVQLNELKFDQYQNTVSQGIWVWRRPFIIKKAENVDVAVILMYTPGTDEQFTTPNEISAIVGLNFLLASVTIVNFYDNLQEDILAACNTYVQYGLLALDNPEGVPFQHLKFLVQDWKMPSSYSYGKEGGMKFIEDALKIQPGQLYEAAQVRESIQKCFEHIDCFLLPHSGDNVISHDSMTGSGLVQKFEPIFLENLVEFLSALTNIETLPLKNVLGRRVTFYELRTYLEEYLSAYNSYDGPSAEKLWKATLDAKLLSFVNSAYKTFMEFIGEKLVGRNYFTEDEMQLILSSAEYQALDQFGQKTNFECTDRIVQKKNMLLQKLETEKTEKLKENAIIRNKITGAISDATTEFRTLLEQAVGYEGTDPFYFHDDNKIQEAAYQAKDTATISFKETLKDECQDLKILEERTLRQILESSFESHMKNNALRRAAAQGEMLANVENHAVSYQNKLEASSQENKMENFDDIQDLSEIRVAVMESFDKCKKPCKDEFHAKYRKTLESRLEGVYLNVNNQHKLRLQEIQSNVDNVIGEIGDKYSNWLQDLVDRNDEIELNNTAKHDEIMRSFNIENNPYPEQHLLHLESSNKLKSQLDRIYKTSVAKVAEVKQRLEQSYNDAKTKAIDFYVQSMSEIISTKPFVFQADLEQSHERLLNEARQVYEQSEKLGDFDNAPNFKRGLVEGCLWQYKEMFSKNQQKYDTAIIIAKNVVHDCHDVYEKTIEERMDNLGTTADLLDCHQNAKDKARQLFNEKCPGKEYPAFVQEYEQQLNDDIDSTFTDLNDLLGMRLREEEAVTKGLLVNCATFYKNELKKHLTNDLFILPQELLAHHKKATALILKNIEQKQPLTEHQEMEMKTVMETLFKKYSLKNDMKLNFNKMGTPPVIGIDLGTTYSCVAVYHIDKVIIIPDYSSGDQTIPSYVSFEKNGSVNVGRSAKSNAYLNPEDTIFDAKRMIGRAWNDPELQGDRKYWPFTVVADDENNPKIKLSNGLLLSPEEISAKVLIKCRETAERFFKLEKGTITQAVITVPAYFTDGQRKSTIAAGQLAKLEVLDILNEPTAAAIAYYQERLDTLAGRLLIFDLGGGTHDVAVLNMKPGDIQLLGYFGDTHLGGEDCDNEMMEYCCREFKRDHKINLLEGRDSLVKIEKDAARRNMSRIRMYCENYKKQLSSAIAVDVKVDAVTRELDMNVEMTQGKFEELNDKYFKKSIKIVDEVLKQVGVSKESIDDIVLVGGSSKIPRVQQLLTEYFKGKALSRSISPDHAVAYGAAMHAAVKNGERIRDRFGLDSLNIGEVTPFSLGIEVVTKELSVILNRNSKIPVKHTKPFWTVEDFQTSINFVVYQGEDFKKAANNTWLGSFKLEGIPAKLVGQETVDVTMEINDMGVLEVSAVIRSTKGNKKVVIEEKRLGMSTAEVERILSQTHIAA